MRDGSRFFKFKPCQICGFRYSDWHHVVGVEIDVDDTDTLCPNHHRCAHMVRSQIFNGMTPEEVEEWAKEALPEDFCREYLPKSIRDSVAALEYTKTNPKMAAKREAMREAARDWDGPPRLFQKEFRLWWERNGPEYTKSWEERGGDYATE